MQEDVIRSVLGGNDTLALMPTGGGKSMCYQVPAMAMPGTCLVISPLIALMKDQVEGLRKKGITAFAIFSGMSRKEVINTLTTVTESNCKFLYVSPERLETALFQEYLPGMGIRMIAVDEAHCISQWGYDFRPPYLRITGLREQLPGVPVLALTASATPEVQQDICDKLTLDKTRNEWKIFRQSFERPNISYSNFIVSTRITKIREILTKVPGSNIIYCRSRKRTREISDLLQGYGFSADFYHAGLSQEERNSKQEAWINNKIRTIVCTNAFGMGIDKPDVRTVIHVDVPDCLENYYQEAGRAGRDGKKSYAVLLYGENDLPDLEDSWISRFPDLATISEVYQAVGNYLQVPAGGGQYNSYDFDLQEFAQRFRINAHTALNALKTLEQEGWLSFNEQVFVPSAIRFSVNKRALYQFEQDHPAAEPLMKLLLRTYEGIFDQYVFISENLLAGLLRKEPEYVIQSLQFLDNAGVIEYNQRKDRPQVVYQRNRARSNEMTIDLAAYHARRDKYRVRTKVMIDYVQEQTECRSRFIGNYFGDEKMGECGICDNCLRKKSTRLHAKEFKAIYEMMKPLVASPVRPEVLREKLPEVKTDRFWEALEYLLAENKLKTDNTGAISLRN